MNAPKYCCDAFQYQMRPPTAEKMKTEKLLPTHNIVVVPNGVSGHNSVVVGISVDLATVGATHKERRRVAHHRHRHCACVGGGAWWGIVFGGDYSTLKQKWEA